MSGWRQHFKDYAATYVVCVVMVIVVVVRVRAAQTINPSLPWWVALFSEIRVVPK